MPNRKIMKPCQTCKSGDCENCLNSPENSIPVKLYTPKGAARAMLAGKVLKDEEGKHYRWDSNSFVGFIPGEKDSWFSVDCFSGLYEEL